MKSPLSIPQSDRAHSSRSLTTKPASTGAIHLADSSGRSLRAILIGLMVPMGMTVLNLSMFGVALPAIRDSFAVDADTVALLVTAYMLPFVLFTPLYGQLGDSLGKRRLFSIGIVIFSAGTVLCLMAGTLSWLFVGRVLQGIGTAGVNPLCIAIITDLFPPEARGRALGTWSSTGPATSMVAPLFAGFLIDRWGWQSIFLPGIVASMVALYVVRGRVPDTAPPSQPGLLRGFDWLGLGLLSGAIISFVAYLSSRAITGVGPLQDWRLLSLAVGFSAIFLLRERRTSNPLIPLHLYRNTGFGRASIVAAIRMFLMSGVGLLIPLYLADIHGLAAAGLGLVMTFLAGSLLLTVRFGGQLADKWDKRLPVAVGLTAQATALGLFAVMPPQLPAWMIPPVLIVYGLGAGLSLAVLHRLAMDHVPQEESGAAAGLYSMGRFFGSIIGITLVGVFLQQALIRVPEVTAYQMTFCFMAAVATLGLAVIWRVTR
jgi:EmrB/QacA subfamily drug resistance transporter